MASYRVIKDGLGIIKIQKTTGEYELNPNPKGADSDTYIEKYETIRDDLPSLKDAKFIIDLYIAKDKEEALKDRFEVLYEVTSDE